MVARRLRAARIHSAVYMKSPPAYIECIWIACLLSWTVFICYVSHKRGYTERDGPANNAVITVLYC